MVGSSARRNGFVANSSAKVDGTVGMPAARAFVISLTLELSRGLTGSMVLAKAALVAVYSCPEHTVVSGGSAASFDRLPYICAGVPSNKRPHPKAIRLSAVNKRPDWGR